jgi:hypothetical protein
MKRLSFKLTFLFIFLFSTSIYADGQDGLVVILDGFKFVVIFSIWIGFTLIILSAIKRKKELNKKRKFLIWIIILLLASFSWVMLKSDSEPFDGPIDSIIHRDIHERLNNGN